MKAIEVNIKQLVNKKKVTEHFRSRPSPVSIATFAPPQDIEENIIGVKTNPGHELHRIRRRLDSKLWDKIRNWD